MLVNQHPEGDAVGVEAVQEVLDVAADEGVEAVLLLVLDHALRHGGDDVIVPVPDLNQNVQETERTKQSIKLASHHSCLRLL